jgi:DNA-binding XRE family transcriptional regulator
VRKHREIQTNVHYLEKYVDMSLHFVTVAPGLTGVLNDAGCIIWQGPKLDSGYGYTKVNRKRVTVHRLALQAKLGRPIKPGYFACHTCDVPDCINPEHLWEGTPAENMQDAARKGRLSSKKGGRKPVSKSVKAADPANLVVVPPGLKGVLTESGCILWQGGKGPNGYGSGSINGKRVLVHRAALEAKLGRPIKPGYCACHACDVRLCINPEHLWEGTQKENLKDAAQKKRMKVFEPGNVPGNHKLTAEEVEEIRIKLQNGHKRLHLAKEYGVSRAAIHRIEYYIGWKGGGVPENVVKSNHCTQKKLTDKQVEEIKMRLAAGETRTHLAEEYGVSRRSIYNIEHGLGK